MAYADRKAAGLTALPARRGFAVPGLLIFLLLLLLPLGVYIFSYTEVPVDRDWRLDLRDDQPLPPGGVGVRFTGTTTLVFSDGVTTWMTDGWFSRPGLPELLLGKIAPDRRAVERGLRSNRIDRLDAIFPLHSHFDHVMDAAEVARLTGARLIGSESTANVGRGGGLADERLQLVADGDSVTLGDFRITVLESRHVPYSYRRLQQALIEDADIERPLVPPASMFDYKVGKVFNLHVQHPAGSFLIVGSAGFIPGRLEGLDVDALFLGVGGLGSTSPDYRDQYWRETVESVRPEQIIPVHWDSLLRARHLPFSGELRLLDAGGDELREFLLRRRASLPETRWWYPPRYRQAVLLTPQ